MGGEQERDVTGSGRITRREVLKRGLIVTEPGQDLAALQQSIQAFWDALPAYDG